MIDYGMDYKVISHGSTMGIKSLDDIRSEMICPECGSHHLAKSYSNKLTQYGNLAYYSNECTCHNCNCVFENRISIIFTNPYWIAKIFGIITIILFVSVFLSLIFVNTVIVPCIIFFLAGVSLLAAVGLFEGVEDTLSDKEITKRDMIRRDDI